MKAALLAVVCLVACIDGDQPSVRLDADTSFYEVTADVLEVTPEVAELTPEAVESSPDTAPEALAPEVVVCTPDTPCDDGDACTEDDHCDAAGRCAGEPIVCTASDSCHDAGVCVGGTCTHPELANGSSCEEAIALDGVLRTAGSCGGGVCRRLPIVKAGGVHACALLADGTLRCWGDNEHGQLGIGNALDIGDSPATAVARAPAVALTDVSSFSLGSGMTCAVTGLEVRCWGVNSQGGLGYYDYYPRGANAGSTPDKLPAVALGTGFSAQLVSAGLRVSCAVSPHGGLKCWGMGHHGYPGVGFVNVPDYPHIADLASVQMAPAGQSFLVAEVANGLHALCARSREGDVRCWGHFDHTGLGNGDMIGDDETPGSQRFVNVGWKAAQVAAGQYHTCAVTTAGDLYCWGANEAGQLGVAAPNPSPVIGPIDLGPGQRAAKVALGVAHTCVMLTTGAVHCWGGNAFGQLGRGDTQPVALASQARAVDLGSPATDIAAGLDHTCAVMRDGRVRCFGAGDDGRLGNGSTEAIGDEPADLPPPPVDF